MPIPIPMAWSITDREDGAVRRWSVKAGLVVVPQRRGHGGRGRLGELRCRGG